MPFHLARFRGFSWHALVARIAGCALALLLAAAARFPAGVLYAQTSAPASPTAPTPTPQSATVPAAAKPAPPSKPAAAAPEVPPITEDQIRQLLIGKDLFLRGGYLDNTLEFNEHGALISHSAQGSYTLCAIRVTRVRLLKHKVELEGERYGLHFLGAVPGEDPTAAVDRVNITPKKKPVRITIDRELVVKEKPQKQPKAQKGGKKSAPPTAAKPASSAAKPQQAAAHPASAPAPPAPSAAPNAAASAAPNANSAPAADNASQAAANPAPAAAPSTTAANTPPAESSAPQASQTAATPPSSAPNATSGEAASNANPEIPAAQASSAPSTAAASSTAPGEIPSDAASDAAQAQAEIAEAPAAERPADAKSVTTTHSQAHANELLQKAIDNVFAAGLDARMMAAMPVYWKLYYQAADDTPAAWPPDPSVLRQSAVDKKARLVSVIDPASNEYAQDHGVAGMAEYHVVVGADGKPGNIAVARPIGFGLDETAVESLKKATFEPAMKDGHPVPVTLDLVVEFRIYSKLTAEATQPHKVENSDQPTLPGPYSVQH